MSIPKTQRDIQGKLNANSRFSRTFYEWKKAFKVGGEPGLTYR